MSKRLRSVKPGEKAPPRTVEEAAATGERRALLVAMVAKAARTLDDTSTPRDVAALTKRIAEMDAEVQAIDAVAEDAVEGTAVSGRPADEAWDPSDA